jgi:hypothetical protein
MDAAFDDGIPGYLRRTPDNQLPGSAQGSSCEAVPTKVEDASTHQLRPEVEKQVIERLPRPAPAFDYAALEPATAADLRNRAARLRGVITKSTGDIISIGHELIAIKARLDHGQFAIWVEREVDVDIRTVQGYMAIAKCAEGKNELISLLSPSAAKMLAAKSTPAEIVEQVIARAGSGHIASHIEVKGLISEDRAARRARREAERKAPAPSSAQVKKARQDEPTERQPEAAENRARAQSIIARFCKEDVRFLAGVLNEEVLREFSDLAKSVAL